MFPDISSFWKIKPLTRSESDCFLAAIDDSIDMVGSPPDIFEGCFRIEPMKPVRVE